MAIYRSTYERRKIMWSCVSYVRATVATRPFTSTFSAPSLKDNCESKKNMLYFEWKLSYWFPLPVFIASRIPSIPPFRMFIYDSTSLSILPPVLSLSIFYVRDQPRKSVTVRSRSKASSSRLPSANISLHPVLVVQSQILSPTWGLPSFNIPPLK